MPRSSRSLAPALLAAEALVVLAAACSGGGSAAAPAPAPTLTLSFTRVPGPGLDAVEVAVDVSGSEATPSLATDRGSLGPIARTGGGRFVSTLLPTTTGEYRVTATVAGTSIVRTVLVLQDVHADWGQPQSVAGLVNTDGYEDGVTIAPDGQTLFVQ